MTRLQKVLLVVALLMSAATGAAVGSVYAFNRLAKARVDLKGFSAGQCMVYAVTVTGSGTKWFQQCGPGMQVVPVPPSKQPTPRTGS